MADDYVRLVLSRDDAAKIRAVVRNGYDAEMFGGTINGQPIKVRISAAGVDDEEDLDADLPDLLVRELRVSDPKEFGRPATPSVYKEYAALKDAAPNGMVYNDEARRYFTERHEIPEELLPHLDHEIYLASGQYRLNQMAAEEQQARWEDWIAITEVEPADGTVLDIRGRKDGPFRVKPAGPDRWALLPKGKRTNGYAFEGYTRQHRAYLAAKERGQVDMDGPAVIMVRIVKRGA